MRAAAITAIALVIAAVLGGCGGRSEGSAADEPGSETVTAQDWAVPLLRKPGDEGAAVMASSDFAAGKNRISFLLVRADNSLVRATTADVYYRPVEGGPTEKSSARLVPIGVKASQAEADERSALYQRLSLSVELPIEADHIGVRRPGSAWPGRPSRSRNSHS